METAGSKVFMRSTVLALDLLIYIPALVLFTQIWQANRSTRTQVRTFHLPFHPDIKQFPSLACRPINTFTTTCSLDYRQWSFSV